MRSEVFENENDAWLMRMAKVEGVVVTDVECEPQCGQEVEMRFLLEACLDAPS